MNTRWLTRKRDQLRERGEEAFTLVEVVITVIILAMITGALSAAFVTSISATSNTKQRLQDSNDAQLIASFLTRDAQAAGGSNPGSGIADPTLGVSLTSDGGCNASPVQPLVVGFKWIDRSTPLTPVTHWANYLYSTTTQQLSRATCVSTAGTTVPTVLANHVVTTPSPNASPVAWCDANVGPPPTCPVAFPKTVSLRVTENNTLQSPGAPYTFTLSASLRPQNGVADPAIPSPLLLLGRPGCGDDGTTGLGMLVGGNLHVYGRTYINAVDNGATCPAMSLVVAANFAGGITSIKTGGTCNQFFSNPCPKAPFITSHTNSIPDPYAALTPPDPVALGLSAKSGCGGPGVYAATMSVSNCNLTAGVYILHNGINVTGTLTSTGGVLLYIDHGTFDASGTGVNITGLAGNTPATAPYAGLAVWIDKNDANTTSCGFSGNQADVCFEGGFFGTSTISGVIYAPTGEVNNSATLASTLNITGIVAQVLSVQWSFFSSMNIGTAGPSPNITTTSLPPWTVNQPYPNTTATATGGTPPYWWSATGLPAGLSIDGLTGVISGTPTAAGPPPASVTLQVTDILGETDTQTISLNIAAAPTITTASLPSWTTGRDYPSTPMSASGGTTPFTWSATGLPAGLTINSAGVISGNTNFLGTTSVTVKLTDNAGATASKVFSLTLNPLPTITGPAALPTPWTQNAAYTPAPQMTGSGGTPNYNWAASGLPNGLTINSGTGVISGTPTVQGTFTPVITLTDASGYGVTQGYTIVINAPLGIGSVSLPNAELNFAYVPFTVPVSGGVAPYTWTTTGTNLPTGMAISAAGVITGTPNVPAQVGSRTITLKVTDKVGAVTTKTFTLTIAANVTITGPATLPNWTLQRDYTATQIVAANGVAPFTWQAQNLPPGLIIDASGVIKGTPNTVGAYPNIHVTVTDVYGATFTQNYSITINALPVITTNSLPSGETTLFYSAPIVTTGGTTPFSWTQNGLPPGLSINPVNGTISGIPTASGTFPVTLTLIDAAGQAASTLPLSLVIAQGPAGGNASLPNGEVSVAYPNTTLTANGGTGPYTFTAANLPPGLSVTGGVLQGTPTTAATYPNVQITTHDSIGGASTTTYTIIIAAAPTITTASLPGSPIAQAYPPTTVAESGGTGPFTWTNTTAMPPGLSIDSTGLITGTPSATGSFTFTVKVTDTLGASATKSFTINISLLPTVTSVAPTSRGQGAQNQSIVINGTGFIAGPSLAATFSNPGITVVSTTWNSATKITAVVNVSAAAATGAGTVSMVNGDGGVATTSVPFTVNARPTITLINPATRSRLSFGSFNVVITGTGFVNGATVQLVATAGTVPTLNSTTWNSATQITISLNANFNTSTNNVTVTNSDGGSFTVIGGFKST